MLNNHYTTLLYQLSEAVKKFNNKQNDSVELSNIGTYIDHVMEKSSNKAKTAFEIERCCLEYDKSININKPLERISSRLTGCFAALEELRSLQDDPAYVERYKNVLPSNINSDTTYTKEAFNSLRYLGNEKNSNATTRTLHEFYEKRQDILKQGRQAFLKEKQQKFEQIKPLKQEKIINKNKGLER